MLHLTDVKVSFPSDCCRTEILFWNSTIRRVRARTGVFCQSELCRERCGPAVLRAADVRAPQTGAVFKKSELNRSIDSEAELFPK